MPPKKAAGGAKAGKSKSTDDGDKGKADKKGGTAVKVKMCNIFVFFIYTNFLK